MKDGVSNQIFESKEYLSDEGAAITPVVPQGALLLSFKLSLGKLAFAGRDLRTNEAIASLVPHDTQVITTQFLYWYLKSFDWVKASVGSYKIKGATLNKAKLKVLPVPVPPIDEQERIVAILDEAFGGVAKVTVNAERNLSNARELFAYSLDQILAGNGASHARKFGDTTLVQIIDGDRGANYPKKSDFHPAGHCLFLSTKNVRPNGFSFDEAVFISKQKDAALRKGKLQRRDVVLTTRGTIGNIALYDDEVPFENIRINSGMLVLRPNESVITSEFLFNSLRSAFFKEQTRRTVSGAAQPQLPIRSLVGMEIMVPESLSEQISATKSIDELESLCNRSVASYEEKLARLVELKKSILDKAFSGELTSAKEIAA